jgi:hypothetical protein
VKPIGWPNSSAAVASTVAFAARRRPRRGATVTVGWTVPVAYSVDLPAPFGPEEAGHPSRLDGEAQVVDGDLVAIASREPRASMASLMTPCSRCEITGSWERTP